MFSMAHLLGGRLGRLLEICLAYAATPQLTISDELGSDAQLFLNVDGTIVPLSVLTYNDTVTMGLEGRKEVAIMAGTSPLMTMMAVSDLLNILMFDPQADSGDAAISIGDFAAREVPHPHDSVPELGDEIGSDTMTIETVGPNDPEDRNDVTPPAKVPAKPNDDKEVPATAGPSWHRPEEGDIVPPAHVIATKLTQAAALPAA